MVEKRVIVIGNMWRDLDVIELPTERPREDYDVYEMRRRDTALRDYWKRQQDIGIKYTDR